MSFSNVFHFIFETASLTEPVAHQLVLFRNPVSAFLALGLLNYSTVSGVGSCLTPSLQQGLLSSSWPQVSGDSPICPLPSTLVLQARGLPGQPHMGPRDSNALCPRLPGRCFSYSASSPAP